ncbi:MAG: cytochrome c-type biogenesis protein CcmH [Gemmatimonadales bacterium]|nr:cytochrome c-type biogenesis protein CcmH [Gemmatimonadales bacterium]
MRRRDFLLRGLGAAALLPLAQPQDSLAGRGATGTLGNPGALGRPRAPTGKHENDLELQAIEKRLACNCGCTLDVFTCRTTDFSCTYSPALHREVLALRAEGKSAQGVLDAFVAKYGEKALMAPKPQGFNLAGYLVPGVLITAAGGALVALVTRRRAVAAARPAGSVGVQVSPSPTASDDEMERLKRELAEVED